MVEKSTHARVGDHARSATGIEWELFVRDDTGETLRHVGSVTAGSAADAYERATKLFGWYADDVWVCQATDVNRFSTHDLDDDREVVRTSDGSESRTYE